MHCNALQVLLKLKQLLSLVVSATSSAYQHPLVVPTSTSSQYYQCQLLVLRTSNYSQKHLFLVLTLVISTCYCQFSLPVTSCSFWFKLSCNYAVITALGLVFNITSGTSTSPGYISSCLCNACNYISQGPKITVNSAQKGPKTPFLHYFYLI